MATDLVISNVDSVLFTFNFAGQKAERVWIAAISLDINDDASAAM